MLNILVDEIGHNWRWPVESPIMFIWLEHIGLNCRFRKKKSPDLDKWHTEFPALHVALFFLFVFFISDRNSQQLLALAKDEEIRYRLLAGKHQGTYTTNHQ